jgi:hypothetical protein
MRHRVHGPTRRSRRHGREAEVSLRDDRDVRGLGEPVHQVAAGAKRKRFGGAHHRKICLGYARSEEHECERVVGLPRSPTESVGDACGVVKGHRPRDRVRVVRSVALDQLSVGDLSSDICNCSRLAARGSFTSVRDGPSTRWARSRCRYRRRGRWSRWPGRVGRRSRRTRGIPGPSTPATRRPCR